MDTITGSTLPRAVLEVKDLPEVYREFKKPIDKEGLQKSKSIETRKGYDTTGYGYAWITERLNDVVGPQCWRAVIIDKKATAFTSKAGSSMTEIEIDLIIQLGNWKVKEYDNRRLITREGVTQEKTIWKVVNQFEALAESPVAYGWHRALNVADAKKGAFTNGLKKAAGFFGIGNEAYKKSIDEENRPAPVKTSTLKIVAPPTKSFAADKVDTPITTSQVKTPATQPINF